jgi:putative drug exporter of the RND superfamily
MSVPRAEAPRQENEAAPVGRLVTQLRRKSVCWSVVLIWLLLIVRLNGFAGHLSKVTDDSASAYLPSSAQSTRVVSLQEAAQGGPGQPQTDAAVVVFARNGGLTAADMAAAVSARAAAGRLVNRVDGLGAPGPLQRSADRKAVEFTANVTAPVDSLTSADSDAVSAIRSAVQAAAQRADDGLQVAVTGSAGLAADSGVKSGNQTRLELTALVIIAVILLIVYLSPVLWILPVLSALGAIVAAKAAAHGLANAGLTVSSLSSSILVVLVFGAATDYALLLIHRYREELRHYAIPADAMAVALRRTLPTLLASAATVTCAMICLLAAQSASLRGLGPVGAVSIVSALIAQTTFLPTLLLVLGRAAFWPRIPREGQAGGDESRLWSGIGQRVARHPAPVALAAVLLLGGACAGLAALQISNNPLNNVKGQANSVVGAQLLADHYAAGVIAPLVILAPPAEASAAAAAARAMPDVHSVSRHSPVEGYADYSVVLSVPPFGASGSGAVVNLRGRLGHDAPGSLVGGQPAIQYDITQAAGHDTLLLMPLVFVVILVVIGLLLQAVVAPLVLVVTAALSFAASFGLSNLIWRYGLGYSGVEAQLPLYIFIFLVALGVDYNIFLSARIREEARRAGIRQGTLRGLAVTGGVITAAGIVLAGTFADLLQLPSVPIAQVGIAVALGVLLDTLLVRTVLVPASLLTIGERVWWPSRSMWPGLSRGWPGRAGRRSRRAGHGHAGRSW